MADNTLNYSSFDFDAIKTDMINNMKANGVFKDYNFAGSNINQLIELFAGLGDLLNFYVNMVADESFLRTADLYESINKIVELIGYNPGGPKSSEVTIHVDATFWSDKTDNYFTINNLPTEDIPNPTLTAKDLNEDGLPILYTPITSTTFVAVSGWNTFSSDINLVQGQYQTTYFSGTGQSFQKYTINDLNAIEEYIIVKVDGFEWTKVDNIYTHGADRIFSTRYGKDQMIEIQFGNGVFGQTPIPGLNNIEVSYIQSLNLKGAIGAGQLTQFDYPIFLKDYENGTNDGAALTMTITQAEASVGHAVPLTVDEIRNFAPKQYHTQNRLVTQSDHQDLILADLNNFVSQTLILNNHDYYTLLAEVSAMDATTIANISGYGYNTVYLYILPKYGYEVNLNLKSRVLNFIEEHKLITLNYEIHDLDYVNIDIQINYKRDPNSLRNITQITTDLNNVLSSYFSKTNFNIGGIIKYSILLKNLQAVDGVTSLTFNIKKSTDINWSTSNIYLNSIQFPVINVSTLVINWDGDEA